MKLLLSFITIIIIIFFYFFYYCYFEFFKKQKKKAFALFPFLLLNCFFLKKLKLKIFKN